MRKNTDFFQFPVMKGKGLRNVSNSRFLHCSSTTPSQLLQSSNSFQNVCEPQLASPLLKPITLFVSNNFSEFISSFHIALCLWKKQNVLQARCRLLIWSYFGHICGRFLDFIYFFTWEFPKKAIHRFCTSSAVIFVVEGAARSGPYLFGDIYMEFTVDLIGTKTTLAKVPHFWGDEKYWRNRNNNKEHLNTLRRL